MQVEGCKILADATDMIAIVLIVVVDVAVVEVHNPSIVAIVGIGSTRPVIVGLQTIIFHCLFKFFYRSYAYPYTRNKSSVRGKMYFIPLSYIY